MSCGFETLLQGIAGMVVRQGAGIRDGEQGDGEAHGGVERASLILNPTRERAATPHWRGLTLSRGTAIATASKPNPPVRVRLFASLRDAMGWSERHVTPVPGPCTPLALWRQLALQPPDPPATVRVAVNQQFADWTTPLSGGEELAFLPPISGG